MSKVCLLVDLENELTDTNSEYYLGNLSKLKRNIKKLSDICRSHNIPLIFTRHIEIDSKTFFAENSKNVELFVEKENDEILITKNKISPFYNTSLDNILKEMKADELIIAGIMTNLCVRSAVSDAYDKNYKITVIKDCCASNSIEINNFTFKDLKNTRPEIEFLTVDEFISKNI